MRLLRSIQGLIVQHISLLIFFTVMLASHSTKSAEFLPAFAPNEIYLIAKTLESQSIENINKYLRYFKIVYVWPTHIKKFPKKTTLICG